MCCNVEITRDSPEREISGSVPDWVERNVTKTTWEELRLNVQPITSGCEMMDPPLEI